MQISAPLARLKREARTMSRSEAIPLHAALDRIAAREGFARWSLLVAKATGVASAAGLLERLTPGDLVLLGARPGQGKTLMGLRLAVEAMRAGRRSAFFTLEYTLAETLDRLRTIDADPVSFGDLFRFDNSDEISADHIVAALQGAPRGTLAVIDYLQLLDQKRDKPDLMHQVRTLKAFARESGVILVLIAQIDRTYDAAAKPCPDLADVRLPNPLDLTLFSKACFLQEGKVTFRSMD